MTTESCPNPDDLRKFVRCSVTEEQADRIAEHLDHCPACEETVVGLERDGDTVADHFRKAAAAPTFAHEPECQQLMQSLVNGTATPPAPATDLATDQSLRDYQILAKIGEGGMGAVYKAVHQRLKKTVALKVLPTNRIGDGPAVARFEREMAVLGQLNHPNIVQALDAGEHDGQHYLVMEYVDGSDLGEIVRRYGRLTIADACQVISQAAQGLQYAHEHGFVHRDIKPSNLMLSTAGQRSGQSPATVKILDLGLARALDQPVDIQPAKADLTTTGQVMGTLDYMAPEQGGEAHKVDIRADIYSLGATFYKLLTGESPFAEHAQKPPLQRLMAIAQQEPPAIRSKRADVPEKLAAIVHRMLAKKPEQRFANPAEVAQALAPFCAGADLAALLIPTGATRVLDAPTQSTVPPSNESGGKHTGRSWRIVLAGFAAFLALAAILTITTRNGTVEVTSPDGKLPDDVTVVVSQGGQEIELLQADNHWSARIVNGEYRVQLRGGDDRFEIKNSQLIVNRMGQAAVTVTLKPTVEAARVEAALTKPVPPKFMPTHPLAITPATLQPDLDKPFVVISPSGEVRGEYKFITEILPILQEGEILEIRGNGPFKIPQIVRNKQALHIRAGEGYRPRFVPGFPVSDTELFVWFQINDAQLTVEGCDFIGGTAYHFMQFDGGGDTWSFLNCRLIQSYTGIGNLISFSGKRLVIRNSLLANNAQYYTIGFGPPVHVEFENNIVYRGPSLFSFPAHDDSAFLFKDNLVFGAHALLAPSAGATGRAKVRAEGNVFVRTANSLVFTGELTEPRNQLEWNGSGNTLVTLPERPLWHSFGEGVKPEHQIQSPTDWNAYWGNAEDLRVAENFPFPFEIMDLPDAEQRATAIGNELTASRGRHPDLPNLGPNMSFVGAGEAYERTLNLKFADPMQERLNALEGGPFVIMRNGMDVSGYVSLAAALPDTKDGDVIEVRSDGTFPATAVNSPAETHLTLRSAPGYRPAFKRLWVSGGPWTMEGMHFIQDQPGNSPVHGTIRRLANCTVAPCDAHVLLLAPSGSAKPVTIDNCYLPQGVQLNGGQIQVKHSVLSKILLSTDAEGVISISRSVLWSHPSERHPARGCIVYDGPRSLQAHISDCLIDTDLVVNTGAEVTWQGERNLYRVHSGMWSAFKTPEGQPDKWRRTLDEWRALWNSDADSQFEESAVLRPEMWRRH